MKIVSIDAFFNEAGAEIIKSLRMPEFIVPTLAMPVAFYSLFALILPSSPGGAISTLALFGVFAVMGPAIFGFGAGVSTERDRGWLQIKRASPAPGWAYIAAKTFATLFYSLAALTLMYFVAGFAGGVELPRLTWAYLLAVHLGVAIPFVFIGLTLGFLFRSNGAVAISNIVFLALSALGGLWIPIQVFPKAMQDAAQFLPSFHAGEIALNVARGLPSGMPMDNVVSLIMMTVIFAITATLAWARQR